MPAHQLRAAALAVAIALTLAGCNRLTEEREAASQSSGKTSVAADSRPVSPPQPAPTPARVAPPDAINDTVITSRIKAGILSDPGMAGTDVSVNTDRGVVSLTGLIKSQEQAAIASAHAQRQDGVMRVDNQLAVNLH